MFNLKFLVIQHKLFLPQANVTASPAVLNMRSCRVKLNEEKSKHAGLAQENDGSWLSIIPQFAV
jgi:hypothetical protein